jgi:hypothetical protein
MNRKLTVVSAGALALVTTLTACGGGGGGDTTGATGGTATTNPLSATPSATGAPAGSTPAAGSGGTGTSTDGATTAPPPAAGAPADGTPAASTPPAANPAFAAFGPVRVASGLTTSSSTRNATSVARLTGGGSVVGWINGGTVNAQILDNNGAAVPGGLISFNTGGSSSVAVAGLQNGEWIVAWDAVTLPAVTPTAQRGTVQFRRYSASGALLGDTTTVGRAVFGITSAIQAVGTTDNGFTIAFAARDVTGSPSHIFAQHYGSDSGALGDVITLSNRPGEQSLPALAALSNGGTALVWSQNFGTDSPILMLPIDVAGRAGAETQLVGGSTSQGVTSLAAYGLTGGRIALAYVGISGTPALPSAFWQTFNEAGAEAGTLRTASIEANGGGIPTAVAITPHNESDGGFHVFVGTTVGTRRGTEQNLIDYVVGNRLDAGIDAQLGVNLITTVLVSTASPTSGDVTGPAVAGFGIAGATDGHFVYAWQSGSGVGVAQVNAAGQ